MRKPGALLNTFDRVFLVLAITASISWLVITFQVPPKIWGAEDIKNRISSLENKLSGKSAPVELPFAYEDEFDRYQKGFSVSSAQAHPDSWLLYNSPTPRPLIVTTPPPPEEFKPELSPVESFGAISEPGKVTLTWKKPSLTRNVRVDGYYLFRIPAEGQFGTFAYKDKNPCRIDAGTIPARPLCERIVELQYQDTVIEAETRYAYVIVAVGIPSRQIKKDGKPLLDQNGNPVFEDVAGEPVFAVSSRIEGDTVPELQIFLTGITEPVGGNFRIFKWMRDTSKWVGAPFEATVGQVVGKTARVDKVPVDFTTIWILDGTETKKVVVEGKTILRRLAYLSTADGRKKKELEMTPAREAVDVKNVFETVLVPALQG